MDDTEVAHSTGQDDQHEEVEDRDEINMLHVNALPDKEPAPPVPKLLRPAAEIIQLTSYHEMIRLPERENWEEAQLDQMTTLWQMGTWTLVDRPAGSPVIGCKWANKVKSLPDRNLDKFKARLAGKGFSQIEGIDSNETFAPVAKFTTVRVLLTLAVNEGLEVHHLDVVAAFLNGALQETVYMEQPKGYDDGSGRVC